ncbi:metal ABC transporter solute-binding protein, Zn/Mn family [Evansella cellulosilytica]|uniref:Periplasmic solute binding protein n=1 Tax=Evansella cellulosilytica (strain ATCC 21833 / DSM 2522 / FERM P-1141 / JCM 9156 / N-4) TaxID=649639 RepID=E6TXS5_EVAC2|nr:zinc ABC transporter substrate-binding protein [Evansella cellulosilytica]ADU30001.1 periplasmic solute binding protein [Evansella cellulosilytica DSM 2522]
MKKLFLLIAMLPFALLVACGEGEEETTEADVGTEENEDVIDEEVVEEEIDPISIYTTLFPLEDFANKIGQEYVEVTNIIPVGTDAHSFEPSASQMIDISEADLFIYNGAGFEAFAERIKETVEEHDVVVITAADGIELIDYDHDHDHSHDHDHGHEEDDHDHGHDHGHEEDDHDHGHDHGHEEDDHDHGHDHGSEEDDHSHNHEDDEDHGHGHDHGHSHGEEDPHVWLDPLRAVQLAENIKDALVEIRPELTETFEQNFEALKSDLEILDQEFVDLKEEITKDTIVVSHAGYGYWDDRYGIHQIGISGISPTNEPSISQMQDMISFIEEQGINYIMFEQNIPLNTAETVRDEVGAEVLWLHNLEVLLDEDIESEEDYFSLMRKNIETLRTALQ